MRVCMRQGIQFDRHRETKKQSTSRLHVISPETAPKPATPNPADVRNIAVMVSQPRRWL